MKSFNTAQDLLDGPVAVQEDDLQSSPNEIAAKIWRAAVKYRWLVLMMVGGVIAITVGVLKVLPRHYTSEATLLVVQQQVPERYVTPNSTTPVIAELEAMKQEVMSRTQMEEIIRKFGLYPDETIHKAPEKVLKLIQQDINIALLAETNTPTGRDYNAFKISFTASTPLIAQQVTSTLTSLFIKQNLKTREEQAVNTTSFLHQQLEVAKLQLVEQEQRLRDFKMLHLGELPEQQQGNLGILTSIQTQLQNTMAAVRRAQEQRVYLESLLTSYQTLQARTASVSGIPADPSNPAQSPLEVAETTLTRLQAEKAALLTRYTAGHPDVAAKQQEIVYAESTIIRLKAASSKAAARTERRVETSTASNSSPVDQPAVAQIKSQLEANRLETANLTKEEKQLKEALQMYQDRLNQTPVREQQLTGMLRDYDLQKQHYTDLLNKELQSQLATNLEKDQGGRQFRLIDPPSLPTIPSSPNFVKVNLIGVAAGLALGLALAFLLALRDTCFHSEKEFSKRYAMPFVVDLPMIQTPAELRAGSWRASFEWVAGTIFVLAICVVQYYSYRLFIR